MTPIWDCAMLECRSFPACRVSLPIAAAFRGGGMFRDDFTKTLLNGDEVELWQDNSFEVGISNA